MKRVSRALLILVAIGISAKVSADSKAGLPELMHYFYGSIQQLKPFLASYDAFKDPKNKEVLKTLINDFSAKASENQSHLGSKPGFNVTYSLLARHLQDVTRLYDNGIYEMAWQRLNATTSLCLACHTRLPKKIETKAFDWAKRGANIIDPKDLMDAEFYFVAHNYNMAMEIFDHAVAKHSDPSDAKSLLRLYERKILFLARVQRDPSAALANLKNDLKNKNLPSQIQAGLKTWIDEFQEWKNEKSDLSKLSDSELTEHTAKMLQQNGTGKTMSITQPGVVRLLRLSGLLYERLYHQNKMTRVPDILLQLARIERELSTIRYYALGDIYLKECVFQFPKSPAAKTCFNEYELSMKQRFGPGMPSYIQDSLNSLRESL